MKIRTRRFIIVVLIIVIPSIAVACFTLQEHLITAYSKVKLLVNAISEAGLKEYLFPTMRENDGEAENAGVALFAGQSENAQRLPVTVFKAFVTGFRDTLPALGSLKGHRETKLGFEKTGVLSLINFKEGDLIAEKALICSLDKEESLIRVKHAESKLKEAESTLSLAKNRLDRITQKYELGGTSKSLYEEAVLEFERSTHSVQIAKFELENAELDLRKCDLFAPHDGLMGFKYVEIGETITPNTLVCDLIDVQFMIVEIGVVERDHDKISVKQQVSISVDAYPGREFIGEVESISPIIEGQSRTFSVKIIVNNQQKHLLPGMFARVKINVFEKRDALVIPSSAIIQRDEKTSVYVVNPKTEIVVERPVSLTYATSDYAVISRGIKEGELVIISDTAAIADGAQVKIVERQVPESEQK
ncbi:efflux RND transporter periplasmic adaptor subunit [bacterium]|nr:efflux RND transporter periplasmic adaptor subunit [bacterium]